MTAASLRDSTTGWTTQVGPDITALAVKAQDQAMIAVASADGSCSVVDATTGAVRAQEQSGVDVPTRLALHPTRDQVAVSGARGYAVWDLHSEVSTQTPGWCGDLDYNARGDLAVGVGRTVVVHRDSGGGPYVSSPTPSTITGLAWTPGGNRVAVSAYGGVYVFDGEEPEPVRTHPYAGSHLAVAVNPNGRWVCSGNQDASVHIWRTADNDELEMAGYPAKVTVAGFDSTGRWFANNGAPELTVWDFIGKGPRGRKPRLLTGHEQVVDLDWRPGTGNVLASVGSEGSVRIWDLTGMAAGRKRNATRVLPVDGAVAVRWCGRDRLVVAEADGAVRLVTWPLP